MKWFALGVLLAWFAASSAGPRDDAKRTALKLKSKDLEKVQQAVRELGQFGREGATYLAAALDDERSVVRSMALYELARLGPAAKDSLPRLVEHGRKLGTLPDATLNYAVFRAGFVGGLTEKDSASGLLGKYEPEMDEPDKREIDHAIETSAACLAIRKTASDDLVALLELVKSLARGDAPNEFTIPRLSLALQLHDVIEEDAAERKRWVSVIEQGLSVGAVPERITSLVMASSFRKNAKEISPAVAARLKSEDAAERAVAAAVLGYIEAPCDPHGAELQPMLADPSSYVRVFAASAIRDACGASTEAEDVLISALSAPEDETRLAAIELMHGFNEDPPKRAVDGLTKCLDSKNERVLTAALGALGALGPEAKKSGSKIASLMKHKSYGVRRAADRALGRVR